MRKVVIATTLKVTSKFIALTGLSLCMTESLFARGLETEDFSIQARSVISSSVSDDMETESENTKKTSEDKLLSSKLRIEFQKALELAKQEQGDAEEEEDSSKTLNEGTAIGKRETKKPTKLFFENLNSSDAKEAKDLEKNKTSAVLSMISASDGGAAFAVSLDSSALPETIVDRVVDRIVGIFQ
jgi:hypothetical protein